MKLPDVVQSAANSKIQAELKPILDRLSRLRATLDAYEGHAKHDVERRVSNSILVALGMSEVAEDPALAGVAKELKDALLDVAGFVGLILDTPVVRLVETPPLLPAPPSEPVPAPPSEPVPPPSSSAPTSLSLVPAPAPTPKPPRKLNPEDLATAKRLLVEIDDLRPDVKNQHRSRLFHLLQAITAEIKILQDRLPLGHDMNERLGKTLAIVNGMRIEGDVDQYIKGLAFGSQGDWHRLAFKSRERVKAYDRDAERSTASPVSKPRLHPNATPLLVSHPSTNSHATFADLKIKALPALPQAFPLATTSLPGLRRQPKAKSAPKPEPIETNHQWPELPHIRGLKKPVLLAGGILIPEKLKSVQERFGLEVEWHEIDHDNPRASQTLMSRVRAGKVGAVILLEGVMRHSTYKPVVEACNINNVPYAMGDKAGIASLQAAFDELERKLCK